MAHLIRASCRLDGDAQRAVDLANPSCRNAVPRRDGEQRLRLRGDEHESDAHVEGTEHLLCRNAALLDLLEYPRDRQELRNTEADVLPQPAELQEAAPVRQRAEEKSSAEEKGRPRGSRCWQAPLSRPLPARRCR